VRHIVRFELGTSYDAVVDEVARFMTTVQLKGESLLVFDRTGVGGAVADLFKAAYMKGDLGPCRWPLGVTLTAGFSRRASCTDTTTRRPTRATSSSGCTCRWSVG